VWGQSNKLIGGAEQGQIFVWDPEKIIRGENALLHTLKKHTGPVTALDVNPFQVIIIIIIILINSIYIKICLYQCDGSK